jgi:hypothetical protein
MNWSMKPIEYKTDILKSRLAALIKIREAYEEGDTDKFKKRIDDLIGKILEERDIFVSELEQNETMSGSTKAFMMEAIEDSSNSRIELLNRVREGEYDLLSKAISDLARQLHVPH